MQINFIGCFIYGMSVMFYSMMAWMFGRKGNDTLSRLIMVLMLILDVECLKDLFSYTFLQDEMGHLWHVVTALDVVIIPFYSFVLMELVKPGWLSWRKGVFLEIPFVILPLLYLMTEQLFWFYVIAGCSVLYGVVTFVLTFFFISQYHRALRERFSYEENINLHWLRAILVSFFFILAVWACSSMMFDVDFDNLYLGLSLIMWMFISYFVYKHESVIDELENMDLEHDMAEDMDSSLDNKDYHLQAHLSEMVKDLFENQKLYLNPKLKLFDVATMVGTNRTYLSRFFNQENGKTFYDYVNNYRVKHAEALLESTDKPLVVIAEESGFNSQSTFRRVFIGVHDCSPSEYRRRK